MSNVNLKKNIYIYFFFQSALATRYRSVTKETTWHLRKLILLFIFTILIIFMISMFLKLLIL